MPNPVAKYINRFNRPSRIPNRKRDQQHKEIMDDDGLSTERDQDHDPPTTEGER
jgi:hypothetical protein